MRVVGFKTGVITLRIWLGSPWGGPEAAWYPIAAGIARKRRPERACHGIFFAYDWGRKAAKNGETAMSVAPYRVSAYNTSKHSENKMHDDTVAKRYGFDGGLVPGVDVMAYMMHQPVARWGRAFLERGLIEARFTRPVYDGELADVTAEESHGVLSIEVRSRG